MEETFITSVLFIIKCIYLYLNWYDIYRQCKQEVKSISEYRLRPPRITILGASLFYWILLKRKTAWIPLPLASGDASLYFVPSFASFIFCIYGKFCACFVCKIQDWIRTPLKVSLQTTYRGDTATDPVSVTWNLLMIKVRLRPTFFFSIRVNLMLIVCCFICKT